MNVDLDPKLPEEESGIRPIEELLDVPINEMEPTRKLKIGS